MPARPVISAAVAGGAGLVGGPGVVEASSVPRRRRKCRRHPFPFLLEAGRPLAGEAIGPNRFAHNGDEPVAERRLPGLAGQPGGGGRIHVTPHRLAVDARQPGDGTLPLDPQPQDLSDSCTGPP